MNRPKSKVQEAFDRLTQMSGVPEKYFGSESQEKGKTVAGSIGDDTLIGSVCERSEAEDGKVPETVDGDPIGLNIEDGNLCDCIDFGAWTEESITKGICNHCGSRIAQMKSL